MTTPEAHPSTTTRSRNASPARPLDARLRPLGLDAVEIDGGFWAQRQLANGDRAIPAGHEQLERAGNLENLRIAAGQAQGEAVGPIFADSDIYKWLEAVAWEIARRPDDRLLALQREVTALVAAAQSDDGYLDSVVQVRHAGQGRYFDLPWSHEHYCAGHLIQAAVAQVRCTGDRGLLAVAIKVADHLAATFGTDRRHDVDGHPVIEMALVELYRETGDREHLELARYFVEARGHGLMEGYGKHPTYFSDRVPVREAESVEGHAVRAVYLAAGATDVATELEDAELLAALERQFDHMWSTKTYLTGGLGARWEGEAFGDPYELPSDRAYAETCAAIGGVQWAWRLLLATGSAKYADAIERMLFNGFLAGVSLAGTEYFYVNALRVRGDAHADEPRSPRSGRHGWFDCACCPPNVMRTISGLAGYLASTDADGLQLHQYAPATIVGDTLSVQVQTDYPWDGAVRLTVTAATTAPVTLSLRIPGWADGATVTAAGETRSAPTGAYVDLQNTWQVGEVVELSLPMSIRITHSDPRVEELTGQIAVERGPLVYALEQTDQPGAALDAITVDADPTSVEARPDLLDGVSVLHLTGSVAPAGPTDWPYPETTASGQESTPVELLAVPYYAWANRDLGAMRVWLPASS